MVKKFTLYSENIQILFQKQLSLKNKLLLTSVIYEEKLNILILVLVIK